MKFYLFLLAFLVSTSDLAAQEDLLTLEHIYSKYSFSSERSKSLKWFNNGESYTTLEASSIYPGFKDIVIHDTKTGERKIALSASQLIRDGESTPIRISGYSWSSDQNRILLFTNTKRVWRRNTKGDYYVYDFKSRELTKLGGPDATPSELMFAKFSPDGSKVGYVLHHNLYIESLDNKEITTLTFDGDDKIINGTFDWAYEEELGCRDGFRWSPDGKYIAYWRIDATSIRNFLMINNTDDIYSKTIPVQYPKVGEKPSAAKIGVVSASGGKTKWMDIPGQADNQYLPRMIWNPDSKSLLIQLLNRAQNNNKVMRCNINSGHAEMIYEDKETAWLEVVDDFQYLKDNKSFTWVSEKSGWKASYIIKDNVERRITPAGLDMVQVTLIDEQNNWLYYIASPMDATQRYLYRVNIEGDGNAELVSPRNMAGTHTYNISPDGKYAVHNYSKSGVPPITEIVSLPDHKKVRTLISNEKLKLKIAQLNINQQEFFKIELEEGISLDAFMIKPYDFDPSKKYPVLFYVYGEPWGQTVLDSWGGSTYLWHQLVAQKGYIIMSIDNRGTPGPKGRAWRKSVYGQIGVQSSADQANGVRKIISTYDFVDENRIGIWGWSGGGSMTLNALFRYPELYHTGISIAPVGNQLLYDNIYQERYSGIYEDMPESYEKGSPVNFAKNLKGNLLIIHGTGDDNVHYQNTEIIINELIKHNKLFSMIAYPNRSHGIYEGTNTSRHLRETMTDYLLKNLTNGGK